MNVRRCVALVLAACLLVPTLTGCGMQSNETEEMGFVLVLGVDKGKKPGTYSVTSMIALPGKLAGGGDGGGGGGGGGGGDGKAVLVTTVEAPTISQGLGLMDTYNSRRISLLHSKGIVVGEDLAKAGIGPVVREVTRFRGTRLTQHLLVTRGKASEALANLHSKIDKDPSRYLEMEALSSQYTGYLPTRSQLFDFTTALVNPGRSPLSMVMDVHLAGKPGKDPDKVADEKKAKAVEAGAIPHSGGDPVEFMGTALFMQDKLQRYLTGPETQLLLMAKGDLQRTVMTVPEPGQQGSNVTVVLRQSRQPRTQVQLVNNEARIQEYIYLEGELDVAQSGQNWTDEPQLSKLEQALSRDTTQRLEAFVRQTMAGGLDPFGYGDLLAHAFPTNSAWEKYRWVDHTPKATVNLTVQVRLRRFGMQLAPLKMGGSST